MSNAADLERRVEALEARNERLEALSRELLARADAQEVTIGGNYKRARDAGTGTPQWSRIRWGIGEDAPWLGMRIDSVGVGTRKQLMLSPSGSTESDAYHDIMEGPLVVTLLQDSDSSGFTAASLSTTWIPIMQETVGSTGGLERALDLSQWAIAFDELEFLAYCSDDAGTNNLEIQVVKWVSGGPDVVLLSATGIGGGAGTYVYATANTADLSNLPIGQTVLQAQWRRASGTGNASIRSFELLGKRSIPL